MAASASNRLLDPQVLSRLSDLELVARTVVQGFVSGLHRSPDWGFSQEFAEYRAYTPGDDLRHIDWNAFARTDKLYLKRYRGETNTEVVVLFDASASMRYGSHSVNKFEYSKYLAAALIYLAHLQRDSTGLIAFHDDVSATVRPSSRQGHLLQILHAIDTLETGTRTDFSRPFAHLMRLQKRRGISIVISDFLSPVSQIIRTLEPLHFRGNEVILFHVLDPDELHPAIDEPVLLVDMETNDALEVSVDFARREYPEKIAAHSADLAASARQAGLEYYRLVTDRPLDSALREYFHVRERRI